MSSNESYSRSEWTSLSIQDRIRAMNQRLEKQDGMEERAPAAEASIGTSPSTDASSPEQAAPTVESTPKRASVVEIWRTREGSQTSNVEDGNEAHVSPVQKRSWKPPAPRPTSIGRAAEVPPAAAASPAPSHEDTDSQEVSSVTSSVADQLKQRNSVSNPGLATKRPAAVSNDRPVDLTIVPAEVDTESDTEPVKRGRVSDIWKHATSTPTHAASHPENDASDVVPRRSKVVDIWTKRTPEKREVEKTEDPSAVPWPNDQEDSQEDAEKPADPVVPWPTDGRDDDSKVEEPSQATPKAPFPPRPFGRTFPSSADTIADSKDAVEDGMPTAAESATRLPAKPVGRTMSPSVKSDTVASNHLKDEPAAAPRKHAVSDIWTKRVQAPSSADESISRPSNVPPVAPSTPRRGSVVERWTHRASAPSTPVSGGVKLSAPSTPVSGRGTPTSGKKQLTPKSFAKIAPEASGRQTPSPGEPTPPPISSSQPSWRNVELRPTPKSASKLGSEGALSGSPSWKRAIPPGPSTKSSEGPAMPVLVSGSDVPKGHIRTVSDASNDVREQESMTATPTTVDSVGDGSGDPSNIVSNSGPWARSSPARRAKALEIAVKKKKSKNSWKYAFPEPVDGVKKAPASLESASSAFAPMGPSRAEGEAPRGVPKRVVRPNLPSKPVTEWTLKDVMKKNRLKPAQSGSASYAMSLSASGSQASAEEEEGVAAHSGRRNTTPVRSHAEMRPAIPKTELSTPVRSDVEKMNAYPSKDHSTPVRSNQLGASSLSSLVRREKMDKDITLAQKPPTQLRTPDKPIRRLAPSSRDTVTNAKLLEHADEPGRITPRKSPGAVGSEERRKFLQEKRALHQKHQYNGSVSSDHQNSLASGESDWNFTAAVEKSPPTEIAAKKKKKEKTPSVSVITSPVDLAVGGTPTGTPSPFAGNRYHHRKQLEARSSSKPSPSADDKADSVVSAGSSSVGNVLSTFNVTASAVDTSIISPTSSIANRASLVLKNRRRSGEHRDALVGKSRAQNSSDGRRQVDLPVANGPRQRSTKRLEVVKRQSVSENQDEGQGASHLPRHDPRKTRENRRQRMGAERRNEPRLTNHYSDSARFLANSPENESKQPTFSFASESEGSSQVLSAEASASDGSDTWNPGRTQSSRSSFQRARSESTDFSTKDEGRHASPLSRRLLCADLTSRDGKSSVSQSFVDESSTHMKSLREAYETMSLQQIANDLKEEVTTVAKNFSFQKLATKRNRNAKFASNLSGEAKTKKLTVPKALKRSSVDEGIAIEVEYVATDGKDADGATADDAAALDRQFAKSMARGSNDRAISMNGDTPNAVEPGLLSSSDGYGGRSLHEC